MSFNLNAIQFVSVSDWSKRTEYQNLEKQKKDIESKGADNYKDQLSQIVSRMTRLESEMTTWNNERIQKEKGKNENLFGDNARVDGDRNSGNESGSLSLTA